MINTYIINKFENDYYALKQAGLIICAIYNNPAIENDGSDSKKYAGLVKLAEQEKRYKRLSEVWSEQTLRDPEKLDYKEGQLDSLILNKIISLKPTKSNSIGKAMLDFVNSYKTLQNDVKLLHRDVSCTHDIDLMHYGFKPGESDVVLINKGELAWFSSKDAQDVYFDPKTHRANLTDAIMKVILNLKHIKADLKAEQRTLDKIRKHNAKSEKTA